MMYFERPPHKHAFEPRYDEWRVGDVSKKIYVRDVCRGCGEVRERTAYQVTYGAAGGAG